MFKSKNKNKTMVTKEQVLKVANRIGEVVDGKDIAAMGEYDRYILVMSALARNVSLTIRKAVKSGMMQEKNAVRDFSNCVKENLRLFESKQTAIINKD